MPEKKLFISDLDGTLLTSDQRLPDKTADFIKKFVVSKKLFSLATARSLQSVQHFIDRLGINAPIALYNGALIYHPVLKTYLKQSFLDSSSVQASIDVIQSLNMYPFVHAKKDADARVFFSGVSNLAEQIYVNERLSKGDDRFRLSLDFSELAQYQIIEITAMGPKQEIDHCCEKIKSIKGIDTIVSEDNYCPGYYWLEIVHKDANKGVASQYIQSYVNANRLICFGDNVNDLPMFAVADESYAVENAITKAKALANFVIPSNDDEGVVKFLAGELDL